MPELEVDDKPRLSYHLNVAMTEEEGKIIRAIATDNDRPVSWVARMLMREALAARAGKQS